MATFKDLKKAATDEQPLLAAAQTALAGATADQQTQLAKVKSDTDAVIATAQTNVDSESKRLGDENEAYVAAVFAAPGHTVVFADTMPITIDVSDGTSVTTTIIGNGSDPVPGSDTTTTGTGGDTGTGTTAPPNDGTGDAGTTAPSTAAPATSSVAAENVI